MLGTLCFLLYVTNVYGICLNGYEDIGNGICYKTFATPSLRRDAEIFCENDGGNLVAPPNAFVNTKIQQEAQSLNSHVWLGLTCSGTTVTSCTYSNGNQVNSSYFTNFAPGHPNSGFGRCVYLAKSGGFAGRWISAMCEDEVIGFGCQIKPNATAPSCGSSYREYNGSCYKILPPSSNADSESACEVECAHLTSIHTQAENNFVRKIAAAQYSRENYTRIGLHLEADGNYEWVDGTNSSKAGYNNFGTLSKPGLGSCVEMALIDDLVRSGKWTSSTCTVNCTSVCKRAKTSPCLSFYIAPTQPPSTTTTLAPSLAPPTCPSTYYLEKNGTIYSPDYPYDFSRGLHCEYVVAAPAGSVVFFSLINDYSEATSSPIKLYNGITASTPFFAEVTTGNRYHASTTPSMKITFDSGISSDKWSATYHAVDLRSTGCNQGVLRAPGAITSPNYSVRYPSNYICSYQLQAVFDKRITLHFNYMNTEGDADVVRIFDGPDTNSALLAVHSGRDGGVSYNVTSTRNRMFVQFTSDMSNEYRGWAATFTSF